MFLRHGGGCRRLGLGRPLGRRRRRIGPPVEQFAYRRGEFGHGLAHGGLIVILMPQPLERKPLHLLQLPHQLGLARLLADDGDIQDREDAAVAGQFGKSLVQRLFAFEEDLDLGQAELGLDEVGRQDRDEEGRPVERLADHLVPVRAIGNGGRILEDLDPVAPVVDLQFRRQPRAQLAEPAARVLVILPRIAPETDRIELTSLHCLMIPPPDPATGRAGLGLAFRLCNPASAHQRAQLTVKFTLPVMAWPSAAVACQRTS